MAKQTTSSPSRRDEILGVAAELIAERGLAGATVRDIGQAAGILSGSLYHHFESKEQIVVELLLDILERQFANQQEIASSATSASEAIDRMIRTAVIETAAHPHESLILRNETRAFSDTLLLAPLAEFRRRSVELWIEVIERGIASGELRSEIDAEVAVLAMVDSVLGAARWFRGDRPKDPNTVADVLVAMFHDGLVAR